MSLSSQRISLFFFLLFFFLCVYIYIAWMKKQNQQRKVVWSFENVANWLNKNGWHSLVNVFKGITHFVITIETMGC